MWQYTVWWVGEEWWVATGDETPTTYFRAVSYNNSKSQRLLGSLHSLVVYRRFWQTVGKRASERTPHVVWSNVLYVVCVRYLCCYHCYAGSPTKPPASVPATMFIVVLCLPLQ